MLANLIMTATLGLAGGQPGEAAGGQQGNLFASFMPLIIIFAIFYFLMIRPQQKQQKKIKEMLVNLKKGDQVVTRGGMHGAISHIDDNMLTLEIAKDVRVKFNREAIAGILNNTVTTKT